MEIVAPSSFVEGRPKNTKYAYLAAIKSFLTYVYKLEDVDDLDALALKYFKECENHWEAYKDWALNALASRPPKTRSTYMIAVRLWLEENEIEFPKKYLRRLRGRLPKGSRARTLDMAPTNQQLKQIIELCNVKGKALFSFLATSGVRLGEALKLKIQDVDLTTDPPTVYVRAEYTKTGEPRVTFITPEAAEYLKLWLETRKNLKKKTKEPYQSYGLFPFTNNVAMVMWNRAVDKAGLGKRDPSTNRRIYHIHTLRKFFKSKLSTVLPEAVVAALMGHEGYLPTYRKFTVEELRNYYLKAMHTLTISQPVNTKYRELEEKLAK